MDDQTPTAPQDELDLLACILGGWSPLDVDLTEADFDQPKHAATWRAMLAVAEQGGQPNPTAVRLALGAAGDNAAGWLLDVFGRPVVPTNAPQLAERVRRAAQLRDLQDLARGLMQRAAADDAEPASVIDWARRKLDAPVGTVRDTETVGDALARVIDQIETGQQSGLSTPWPDLDRVIHGLAQDRLYVVAARPGVGKSILGQNLAWHWARKHKLPTYFASLEMAVDELVTRTVAQAAKVNLSDLMAGQVDDRGWDKINHASPALTDARIHICADPGQTLDTIRAGARRLQRREGLGLVVVDYLQLMTPRDRRMPREQQVAEASRGLKLLAKELHVPVVAMSQVRRLSDGEKNRAPSLSDLRESGAIEQDADAVLILHIPDPDDLTGGELHVAKARAGQRDRINVQMLTHWATIAPALRAWERPPAA